MSESKVPTRSEVWKMFRGVDLTPFHKNKNNLTYVPWARAWSTAMDLIGDHLHIRWHGMTNAENVTLDYIESPGGTASVCCSALVGGEKYAECTLAVMDYRNAAIENPTSVDLQNSRQRCQTKVLALLGLGLYLWENEGEFKSPEKSPEKKVASRKKTTKKKATTAITAKEAATELKTLVENLWERGWEPEKTFAAEIKSVVHNPETIAPEEIVKLISAVEKAGEIALQIHKEEN